MIIMKIILIKTLFQEVIRLTSQSSMWASYKRKRKALWTRVIIYPGKWWSNPPVVEISCQYKLFETASSMLLGYNWHVFSAFRLFSDYLYFKHGKEDTLDFHIGVSYGIQFIKECTQTASLRECLYAPQTRESARNVCTVPILRPSNINSDPLLRPHIFAPKHSISVLFIPALMTNQLLS